MEKVVYAYVVADLLHIGHVTHLENAKVLGDKLVVGVLVDFAVQEKKNKPIIPFAERIRLIQSLKCVDCAVAQDTYSPIKNILNIKPDILVESSSHADKDLIETTKAANSVSCKIIKLPYYPNQSSTKIKEKIKNES